MDVTLEQNVGHVRERNGTIREVRYDTRMVKVNGRTIGYTHLNPGGNVSTIIPKSALSESQQRHIRQAIAALDFPDDPDKVGGDYIEFQWVPEDEPVERKHKVRRPRRVRKRSRA